MYIIYYTTYIYNIYLMYIIVQSDLEPTPACSQVPT